jgi:hypothetical protein
MINVEFTQEELEFIKDLLVYQHITDYSFFDLVCLDRDSIDDAKQIAKIDQQKKIYKQLAVKFEIVIDEQELDNV